MKRGTHSEIKRSSLSKFEKKCAVVEIKKHGYKVRERLLTQTAVPSVYLAGKDKPRNLPSPA